MTSDHPRPAVHLERPKGEWNLTTLYLGPLPGDGVAEDVLKMDFLSERPAQISASVVSSLPYHIPGFF